MTTSSLRFADPQTVADLRTFTARARANDDGGMRLVGAGRILAAYVCTLRPTVLGEAVPTVLGLRTMELAEEADVDTTVALGSVLDRLAHMPAGDVVFPVPATGAANGTLTITATYRLDELIGRGKPTSLVRVGQAVPVTWKVALR